MKKIITTFLVLIILLGVFLGFRSSLKEATFENLEPTIYFDKTEYVVTNKTISEDKLDEQIAKVTQSIWIVSYTDEQNPYKNPSEIYKIKEQNISEAVALKMNGKFYVAKIKK